MVVLLAARAGCIWMAEVAGQRASGHLRATVRATLAQHLVAVGPAGLDQERVGEVAATVGTGVDSLDAYLTAFLPAAALAVVVPALVFVTIGVLDPWSTLILVFTGPMLVLLLAVIGGRTRALTQRRFQELGWLSSFSLDMIRGLATLKAFRRAADGADTIGEVSRRYGDSTMDVLRTAFQTSLVMEWAATAATALVAVQVSFRLVSDRLSFGTALAVLVLTPEFFAPLRRLALEYHAGQAGRAAVDRIEEIRALPVLAATSSAGRAGTRSGVPAPTGGAIECRDVCFTYPGSDRPALEGIDLRVEAGETVALVGPSGAGKTTVAHLVMRFMDPTGGSITVGGVPLRDIDPAGWRAHVAWVPQHPAVFAGTVADNIRLARPDASTDQVRAAARAGRGQTTSSTRCRTGSTPQLGEHGLRLSGGQRQRLAIARAALRDAPFVVLDEFTAHLDDRTEAQVLEAVGALLQGRTALVIAHRGATIAAAAPGGHPGPTGPGPGPGVRHDLGHRFGGPGGAGRGRLPVVDPGRGTAELRDPGLRHRPHRPVGLPDLPLGPGGHHHHAGPDHRGGPLLRRHPGRGPLRRALRGPPGHVPHPHPHPGVAVPRPGAGGPGRADRTGAPATCSAASSTTSTPCRTSTSGCWSHPLPRRWPWRWAVRSWAPSAPCSGPPWPASWCCAGWSCRSPPATSAGPRPVTWCAPRRRSAPPRWRASRAWPTWWRPDDRTCWWDASPS